MTRAVNPYGRIGLEIKTLETVYNESNKQVALLLSQVVRLFLKRLLCYTPQSFFDTIKKTINTENKGENKLDERKLQLSIRL